MKIIKEILIKIILAILVINCFFIKNIFAAETVQNNVKKTTTTGAVTWYSTLSAATSAATNGDTITVYKNFTENVSVEIKTQNLTIKAADGYNPVINWTNTTSIGVGTYTPYSCVVIYTSVTTSTTFGGGTGTLTFDASLASDDDNKGQRARVLVHCGSGNLNFYDGIILTGGKPGGGNYNDKKTSNYKPDGSGEITGSTGNGAGVLMRFGTLNMYGGTIKDNYSLWGSTTTHNFVGGGGGICLCSGTTLNLYGGVITHNAAGSGGGGGILVDTGAALVQTGGTISENVCNFASGGGIGVNPSYKKVIINGGNIVNNKVISNGGGIFARGDGEPLQIIGGNIANNTAGSNGGGVLFWTVGTEGATNKLIVGGTANINNNNALCGGGISIGRENASTGKKCYLEIGGNAIIEKNIATSAGGGLYLQSDNESRSINNVLITGGNISNNEAPDGGGLYVAAGEVNITTVTLKDNISSNNAGGIYVSDGTLNISNGNFENNFSSKNGGAVYLANGDLQIADGEFINNNALNGGAIYISGGDLTMNGGNLGIVKQDKKNGNKAVCGGAVYILGGIFKMNGGIIEGNTATESGGGIQVSDGNVYITAGKIYANVARGEKVEEEIEADVGYGGGIYVDGGEIVSITGGEISNNVAAKNGGGIEIKTDKVVTVDVYSGSFIDNVADDCGGAVGIDCDNGTINVGKEDCDGSNNGHIHPVLSGNLAGKQGGGFYMSGKDAILNIYCGTIDNNIVVAIENNFDQSSGTVTVYDGVEIGEANEGVIVIGGTFIDKRNQDEETVTIIYQCNFENSEDYKQAVVTKDAMITLPADIFGIEDYEIVGWTTHKYNTMDIEYRAGEIIEIDRDIELYAVWVLDEKNEPTYMIVIPSEMKFNSETNNMIFDIEATLNLFPRTKMLNINVAEEEYKLKYYMNGILKDTIAYELTKGNEKINVGDIVASFNSDTALISYIGREELMFTLIELPEYMGRYEGDLTFFVSIEDV